MQGISIITHNGRTYCYYSEEIDEAGWVYTTSENEEFNLNFDEEGELLEIKLL